MATPRTKFWSLLLAGLWMTLPTMLAAQAYPETPGPASGRPLTLEEIQPADVLARTELLRDELERVRFEMGRPKDSRPELGVRNVAPREAIFQALTLFRKANLLRFEVTGDLGTRLQIGLPPDIRPYHVWKVVDAAYQRLLDVKQELGIREPVEEKQQDSSATPTEVFRAIVQANRQFDRLIAQQLSPRDVFQEVRLATHYAARLLEQFPETTWMPAAPTFEHGKRPLEVYHRLLECYARIRAITERSGIEALKLEVPEAQAGGGEAAEVSPSQVYEMAILLVSELAYLHAQLQETDAGPLLSFDPDYKLPAHVYQRAGTLLHQLTELEARVEANPTWLGD